MIILIGLDENLMLRNKVLLTELFLAWEVITHKNQTRNFNLLTVLGDTK